MRNRAAFSLIELVLAIVVIAISVMTIPLMLQQSAKNDQFTALQESIFAARTKLGNILTFKWDQNSIEEGEIIRVLDVNAGDSELDRILTVQDGNRRIGHLLVDKRRRFKDKNTTLAERFPTSAIDKDVDGNPDDIDDFQDEEAVIGFVGTGTPTNQGFDYLDKDLNITTKLYYLPDTADYNATDINFTFDVANKKDLTNPNSTNIKMIELTVTSSLNNNRPFVFRSFSSNIGQSMLESIDTSLVP
ncbi:MAG: hypothetical protein B6D59_03165 [Campylobacteraceae bacterium 4484_4]|nr:MAG: hypothetical protein B6D59_03165 [Campylobacteraceae bacterium 4484_4]